MGPEKFGLTEGRKGNEGGWVRFQSAGWSWSKGNQPLSTLANATRSLPDWNDRLVWIVKSRTLRR
jgi:hypothetical protein